MAQYSKHSCENPLDVAANVDAKLGSSSKQSEKDYGRSASSGAWERTKPFAPPGEEMLAQSLPLIHDFAIAVGSLNVAPTHLILDLGAGACWCSEWLQRLNLRTVSVDISLDLLKIGRTRLMQSGAARVVVGDIECLPFAGASFDRVICLNALHHISSTRAALTEIWRILQPSGLAVFSEPGKGHSDRPTSVAAVRDFGVLERDMLIPDFIEACRAAGFSDVCLKPLSYAVPSVDLRLDDWLAWQALARRRRPLRALQKIGMNILELFGLAKDRVLFEETVTIHVIRVLRGLIEEHPILVAYKDRT